MKKITFLLCMFFAISQTNAQIWTISSCSAELGSNTYGPMSSVATANATSRTAVIYPASQLSTLTGLQLTSMYFKRISATGAMAGTPNFKIYLKEVSGSDWGTTALDWATATTGATLVYDSDPSTIVGSTAGWKSFPLTGAFTYSGTQNLAVFTEYQNTTASAAITWSYEYTASCINTANSNTTKYSNNTTGTYPASLATSNYRRPLIGFDFPVSCPAPSLLTATGVTTNSVDLGWVANGTETGWAYVVQPQGTGYPTGTGVLTSVNPTTVSGLSSSTNYEVYIRANCGVGDSSFWIGPINFTTTCAPVSVPLLENFSTFLPSVCWFNRTGGDLTTGPTSLTGSGWVADGFANAGTTGAVRNEIWTTGANDWLISPEITIPATGYELKFDAAATQFASVNVPTNAWESDDSIEVLVSTTGLTNWTPIFTYSSANQPSNTGTPNIIDLDAYSGQNIRIAFRAVEGATNGSADIDFSIDNFQIRLTPSCVEPLNLVFSSVTATTANISWDDTVPSPTTGFEYFVSTTNTVPVTAGTATTSTFAALSGLLPQTTYYIFVRSDCSAGDFSPWTGPISFTTACTSLAIPWLENFDALATGTNVFPTCWAYTNTLSNWSISTAPVAFSGANSLRRTWSTNGWAFTPMFTLTAGTSYTFSYYVRTNDATVGYDVTVGVGNSQTSAGMTTTLSTVVGYQGPTWTLVTLEYTPSVSGDYSFGVHVVAPLAPNGINFDNFELKLTPACPAPITSVSSVSDTSANISWPAVASASSGYEYVLDNVAADPAGSGTSTMTLAYSATGLTQSTVYYFHIRSVCSAGTYSTWSTVSFTTLATPPSNDNCSGAIALTPGATFATNPVIATNVGATGSTETAPGCASYTGGDVWYSVIVPASGNISLETGTNTGTTILDTGLAAYSGTCGALTLVECDDDDSTNGNFSLISLTGRTPGELLYIRAWEYGNDISNTFTVSAYDASLSSASFDKSTFVAYPNPVKDVLNLSYKTAINNVRVINLLGQEVLNTKTNSNDVQVNMSALTAGAYIVTITFEDSIHTIKVIKQ